MRGDGVMEFPYHRHTMSHSVMLSTFHNKKNTSFDMFYNSTYLHHAMSHADHVTKNALWIRDKDYTWYSVVWSKLYFTFHYIHIFVMSLYVHTNAIR